MISIEDRQVAADGSIKYLLCADESSNLFEAVVFKLGNNKFTVCISTQIGCKMHCSFCATAHIGYKRNLTAEEMMSGLDIILEDMKIAKSELRYVALMGMGEPLDNYSETVKFLDIAHSSGIEHVSLSTVGVPAKIVALAQVAHPPTLFVSLHFTSDDVRQWYMPAAGRYSIREVLDACRAYYQIASLATGKVRVSYLLLKGINDGVEDAKRLCEMLSPQIFKINLLRYNVNEFSNYLCSSEDTVNSFIDTVRERGFEISYRPSKGTEISGGCGQLVGKKQIERKKDMNNDYRDFHIYDTQMNGGEDVQCLSAEQKQDERWMPFVSFPITKICNFRCVYCGSGGESTASDEDYFKLSEIKRLTEMAIKAGVKKFRITGGEPFVHPQIFDILDYFGELGLFTLVNTNGSLIKRNESKIRQLKKNIRFAVSLDTLKAEKLNDISGYSRHKDMIDGIELLAETGNLMRLNTVVSTYNYEEIYDIIDYCGRFKCDLKLLDVVSVPVPYGIRTSFYQEISSLEREFVKKSSEVYAHEYTKGFGTPCKRYKIGGVFVTVKNSVKGSHYDETGICKDCPYFPCHEGLYDIFALSDGRLCACRWTEKQIGQSAEEQLSVLVQAFKRAEYSKRTITESMPVRSDLMKNNTK